MESRGGAGGPNWTEAVEDFLLAGEADKAISLLETTVSNLENDLVKEEVQNKNGGFNPSFLIADQLSVALYELSKLYSGEGFSDKAEQTLSRSLQIKHRKGGLCTLVESTVSNLENEQLENKNGGNPSKTLHDLSKLYSGEGFPDKAEETLSRSLQIKHRNGDYQYDGPLIDVPEDDSKDHAEEQEKRDSLKAMNSIQWPFTVRVLSEDDVLLSSIPPKDWETLEDHAPDEFLSPQSLPDCETLADRAPEELLSPQSLPGISSLSLEVSEDQHIKWQGMVSFSSKTGLYFNAEDGSKNHAEEQEKRDLKYGLAHVLVLAGFPRTTKMEEFKGLLVIRWASETTTILAICRTPPIDKKARKRKTVHFWCGTCEKMVEGSKQDRQDHPFLAHPMNEKDQVDPLEAFKDAMKKQRAWRLKDKKEVKESSENSNNEEVKESLNENRCNNEEVKESLNENRCNNEEVKESWNENEDDEEVSYSLIDSIMLRIRDLREKLCKKMPKIW